MSADPSSTLRGSIDIATRALISGWAQDKAQPNSSVTLLVTLGDALLARVTADRLREDLRDAGIGNGRHGFEVNLKGLHSSERHVVSVVWEEGHSHLDGSPFVLEPAEAFDEAFRDQCAAVLSDVSDDAGLRARLAFLAEQAEALLTRRAQRRTRRDERAVQRQLKWRWSNDLASGSASEALLPRALVIDEYVPSPNRDAGSNAVLSHMRALQSLGFEVNFAATDMGADVDGVLERAGIACCHAPWHGSVEEVLRREADNFDLIYLHRASVAGRYLGLARYHQAKARLIFSVADLHFLRLARQAKTENRPELYALARRFQAAELQAAASAHAVITHSTYEAVLLRKLLPNAQVHVVPWVVKSRPTEVPFESRAGLAFIGHYGHIPNLDAAQWLVDEIMPLVRASHCDIGCLLAGSAMPDVLRRPIPGVEAVGQVESLTEVFNRVRLTVAPMTYGAGIKGKVLESLAAGIPCVCTPVAAEGLDLPPVLQSLIAPDAAGIANCIIRLHEDEAFNQACRQASLAYVSATLSEDRVYALMRAAVALPAGEPGLTINELAAE